MFHAQFCLKLQRLRLSTLETDEGRIKEWKFEEIEAAFDVIKFINFINDSFFITLGSHNWVENIKKSF